MSLRQHSLPAVPHKSTHIASSSRAIMIRSNLLIRRVATASSNGTAFFAGSTPSVFAAAASSSSPVAATADALVFAKSSKVASSCIAFSSFSSSPSAVSSSLSTKRYFASSTQDACTELGSILQREINEETEAAIENSGGVEGQLPSELAELKSTIAKKWTILEGITGIGGDSGETGSGATVRMLRKNAGTKGAKIGIVFHCQDTEEDSKFEDDDMFDQEPQDEEDVEESAQAVRFGVVVSKGGKTVVLQCRCGYELNVDGVIVRDGDMESVLAQLAGGEGLHAALYQGPEFTELAEDLQTSFEKYVKEECGVDDDVTAFISMYCDYREQEEYVSFMKTAVEILD